MSEIILTQTTQSQKHNEALHRKDAENEARQASVKDRERAVEGRERELDERVLALKERTELIRGEMHMLVAERDLLARERDAAREALQQRDSDVAAANSALYTLLREHEELKKTHRPQCPESNDSLPEGSIREVVEQTSPEAVPPVLKAPSSHPTTNDPLQLHLPALQQLLSPFQQLQALLPHDLRAALTADSEDPTAETHSYSSIMMPLTRPQVSTSVSQIGYTSSESESLSSISPDSEQPALSPFTEHHNELDSKSETRSISLPDDLADVLRESPVDDCSSLAISAPFSAMSNQTQNTVTPGSPDSSSPKMPPPTGSAAGAFRPRVAPLAERKIYLDFMAQFLRPSTRPSFEKNIGRVAGNLNNHRATAMLRSLDKRPSRPPLYLPHRTLWCTKEKLHALCFEPTMVYSQAAGEWSANESVQRLCGTEVDLFVLDESDMYYAGVYFVHDMSALHPPGSILPRDISFTATMRAMGLERLRLGGREPDYELLTEKLAEVFADRRPRTACFGLQCVGFDGELYRTLRDKLRGRERGVRPGRPLVDAAESPVQRPARRASSGYRRRLEDEDGGGDVVSEEAREAKRQRR
ncbi:hypothetical protein MIND_01341500 [Mycena indigotica]|uniref:Uncharacterized protein n=1 Tax=Mycena indigotica TaxID=2126181 RepID=A0A8H6S1S5_9AGAR|nr:uncharacterized protein MIND_01341500 [Mycena indigotica]KAF7290277.1 hypothetical protein MIND_01341500 [Mycena indigotica]